MRISRRLITRTTTVVLAVALSSALLPQAASAGPAPALCDMDTVRGEVPANFYVEGCVDGDSIWVRNTSEMPLRLEVTGSAARDMAASFLDPRIESTIVRLTSPPVETALLPGDLAHITLGQESGAVGLSWEQRMLLTDFLVKSFGQVVPLNDLASGVAAVPAFFSAVVNDYLTFASCMVGKTRWGQAACGVRLLANFTADVAQFAVELGALAVAIGKKAAFIVDFLTYSYWWGRWTVDVLSFAEASKSINQPATTTSTTTTTTTTTTAPPPTSTTTTTAPDPQGDPCGRACWIGSFSYTKSYESPTITEHGSGSVSTTPGTTTFSGNYVLQQKTPTEGFPLCVTTTWVVTPETTWSSNAGPGWLQIAGRTTIQELSLNLSDTSTPSVVQTVTTTNCETDETTTGVTYGGLSFAWISSWCPPIGGTISPGPNGRTTASLHESKTCDYTIPDQSGSLRYRFSFVADVTLY